MGKPHGIGIIGLGNISRSYLDTLVGIEDVRVVAVADLDPGRAESVADATGARALSPEELLADPAVETVLNLTIPAAHAGIALAAIAHDKDVYGEKPFAATLDEGRQIVAAAAAAGRRAGSAPDTVLGTGIQTARSAVDSGLIGRPVSATATWVAPGHERWHPNPDFYYRAGGGPLLDMGPYYLTSLVHLLGPIAAVIGRSSRATSERVIATGPRAGERFPVEVDTHVVALLEHASGALSSITMSFDAVHSTASFIEVHGESGSLALPDPNQFDGQTLLWRDAEGEPEALPERAGFVDSSRGVGLLDLIRSTPDQERASGAMGMHVLEVMLAILESGRTGERGVIASTVERPPLVPLTSAESWRRHA
ncbi:MAG TPA: Gfo/Idh/MocA family oxidoreductase [Galbitalea sp.]|nr:Gfo/Idh/MocA family oxidoreductase [Galbitalea sp.]